MEYRVRLGEKTTGAELLTNGDFAGGFAGWQESPAPSWSIIGGAADFSAASTTGTLAQTNILEVGQRYRIKYDRVVNQVDPDNTVVLFGTFGTDIENKVATTYEIDKRAIDGTGISFKVWQNDRIDNVSCKLLKFNEPLNDEPMGLDKIRITDELDQSIYGLFKKFSTELEFVGDGYDFILAARQRLGRCGQIRVLIESKCDPLAEFEDEIEGVIFIADCDFDREECIVKTAIEDASTSSVIIRNKNEKIYPKFDNPQVKYLLNPATAIDPHDAAGTRPYSTVEAVDVFKLFRRTIHAITGVQVDFESDLLTTAPFLEMQMVFGASWRFQSLVGIGEKYSLSFTDLFEAFNSVLNIGITIIEKPNGVPFVKIEKKEDLRTNTPILTLNNVAGIKEKYDTNRFYKTVSIGYAKVDGSDNNDGEQYVVQDKCGTEDLQIVSAILQDSEIIFDLLDGTITDTTYDEDWFYVQADFQGGNLYNSRKFGANSLYNGDIDVVDNITRWVNDLPAGVRLQRDSDDDNPILKTNEALVIISEFSFPLSKEQHDLITDLSEQIRYNNPEKGIPDTDGFILKIDWNPQGSAVFTLLIAE